jgi:hypothetical protein
LGVYSNFRAAKPTRLDEVAFRITQTENTAQDLKDLRAVGGKQPFQLHHGKAESKRPPGSIAGWPLRRTAGFSGSVHSVHPLLVSSKTIERLETFQRKKG